MGHTHLPLFRTRWVRAWRWYRDEEVPNHELQLTAGVAEPGRS